MRVLPARRPVTKGSCHSPPFVPLKGREGVLYAGRPCGDGAMLESGACYAACQKVNRGRYYKRGRSFRGAAVPAARQSFVGLLMQRQSQRASSVQAR